MVMNDKTELSNTAIRKKEFNYKMIDLMKCLTAIMVICIHCNQLCSQEYLNFHITC